DHPSRRGRVVVLQERARCGPLVGLRVMLVPEDADLVVVETTTAERTGSGSDLANRLWVRGGAGVEFDACAQPQGSTRRCPVAGLTNQVRETPNAEVASRGAGTHDLTSYSKENAHALAELLQIGALFTSGLPRAVEVFGTRRLLLFLGLGLAARCGLPSRLHVLQHGVERVLIHLRPSRLPFGDLLVREIGGILDELRPLVFQLLGLQLGDLLLEFLDFGLGLVALGLRFLELGLQVCDLLARLRLRLLGR